MIELEHVNITVTDPKATAAWMVQVFDWKIRWEGAAINGGYTVHVGSDASYVALYTSRGDLTDRTNSYDTSLGLNHIAVVVDDLEMVETKVKAAGFKTRSHADYEPGQRFYFDDSEGLEVEVVCYDDAS